MEEGIQGVEAITISHIGSGLLIQQEEEDQSFLKGRHIR